MLVKKHSIKSLHTNNFKITKGSHLSNGAFAGMSIYMQILVNYYAMNHLKINQSKTVIMTVPYKKSNHVTSEFLAGDVTIKSSRQMTILGCIFSQDATPLADLSHTIRLCHEKLNLLFRVKSYCDSGTRAIFARAFVLSRLQYMCHSYAVLPEYHKARIQKLLATLARFSRGNYGFRIRISTLLTDSNLPDCRKLLLGSCAKIHL